MEVVITPEVLKQAEALHEPILTRVLRLVERLHQWPNVSGAKPLRGDLVGHFRLRTGDYRVQFRVEGQRIVVEKIGHRDGFYDE
jgi:mRNA-degrading endonuclease RelE of RelBE toxin-antitoxin system